MHINNRDAHYISGTASFTYQEHALHSPKHISHQVKCICNSYNANTQTGVAWTNAETERLRCVFLRVSGLLSSANTKTLKSNYALEDETDEKWETPPPASARQMCVCVCVFVHTFVPNAHFCKIKQKGQTFSSICCGLLNYLNHHVYSGQPASWEEPSQLKMCLLTFHLCYKIVRPISECSQNAQKKIIGYVNIRDVNVLSAIWNK